MTFNNHPPRNICTTRNTSTGLPQLTQQQKSLIKLGLVEIITSLNPVVNEDQKMQARAYYQQVHLGTGACDYETIRRFIEQTKRDQKYA